MRTKGTALLLAASVLLLAGAFLFIRHKMGPSEANQRMKTLPQSAGEWAQKDPASQGVGAGVPSSDVSSPMGTGWVRSERDRETYLKLAESPTKIDELVRAGDPAWRATMVDLRDPLLNEPKVEHCKDKFTKDFNSGICKYNLDFVMERQSGNTGEIVFSRPVLEGDVIPAGCAQLAACEAQAKLGSSLPLPEGGDTLLAIQTYVERQGADSKITDRKQLEKMAMLLEQDVEASEAMTRPDVPDWEYQVELQKRVLAYVKYRLENM